MDFQEYFPIWDRLAPEHQAMISSSLMERSVKKGTVLHNGDMDCTGLLLIKQGQLRAYILSEEGREITLFRVDSGGTCILSAACVFRGIEMENRLWPTGSGHRRRCVLLDWGCSLPNGGQT